MNSVRVALSLLLLSAGPLFAKTAPVFHYLSARSITITSILNPPPRPGSIVNQADVEAVLARQHGRTRTELDRIRSEVDLSPAAFGNVIGSWFTPTRLPLTFALLNKAASDAELVSSAAKRHWNRPRPPLQDARIHPAAPVPKSPSYPSAHAMRGALWAAILAQLDPSLSDSILARGDQIGEDRVIAGVHFPTDVAAGQRLGRVIAAWLPRSPVFRADLRAARDEFARMHRRFASVIHSREIALAARGNTAS